MGLRKHEIEWTEEPAGAQPIEAVPSPALMLQQMLQERTNVLAQPQLTRDQLRKLVMMLAAGGFAVWMALISTASSAVAFIA